MTITPSHIKSIIDSYMPRGQWVTISSIQKLVQSHHPLTTADWAPHTTSRPTTYPVWKNRIQGVLSDMKAKNMIQHDSNANTYML